MMLSKRATITTFQPADIVRAINYLQNAKAADFIKAARNNGLIQKEEPVAMKFVDLRLSDNDLTAEYRSIWKNSEGMVKKDYYESFIYIWWDGRAFKGDFAGTITKELDEPKF